MDSRRRVPPLRVVRPAERAQASRERLAFNYGRPSVPSRQLVEAVLANEAEPTFATAAYAEPRDWGYVGLFAFTAVLLLRPQDQFPVLRPLHLAEVCALIGTGPMMLHRFARRLPVFRVTPETVGLIAFGLVMLATVPFSIWPGGALSEFTESYLKILVVFVLMMNTLTTPHRLERITWLIILCVGYIAARGVVDYARGVNMVENGRLAGAVSGHAGDVRRKDGQTTVHGIERSAARRDDGRDRDVRRAPIYRGGRRSVQELQPVRSERAMARNSQRADSGGRRNRHLRPSHVQLPHFPRRGCRGGDPSDAERTTARPRAGSARGRSHAARSRVFIQPYGRDDGWFD